MDPNSILAQLGIAIPRKMPGIHRVVSTAPLMGGSHHNNVLVTARDDDDQNRYLVVRMPKSSKRNQQVRMHKEHLVLQHLNHVGFPYAPESYVYDASLEYLPVPYAIQGFVKTSQTEAIVDQRIAEVATVIACLHSINPTSLLDRGFSAYSTSFQLLTVEMRHVRDWMHRTVLGAAVSDIESYLEETWQKIDSVVRASPAALKNTKVPPVLMHGDLGSHNIGWTPQGPYLFDWEVAAIGDAAFDIAKLFRNDLRSAEQRFAFLSSYWNQTGEQSPGKFIQRVNVFEYLAALQSTIWSLGVVLVRRNISRNDPILRNLRVNLSFIDPEMAAAVENILLSRMLTDRHS